MIANTIERSLRELGRKKDFAEIQNWVVGLRDWFGVDHVVYHWVSADGEQFGFGSYPPSWVQHYIDKDYLRVHPVILGCFQRFHPVDWKRLDWSSKSARQFRKDAIDFGVGNQGYSVPIRGPNGQFALFTVSHTCSDNRWADLTMTYQRDIILVAHYLNQKALEVKDGGKQKPSRPLSPREVDSLTYLAMGYGRGQVADMLSISEHTLRAYIESARAKLGALNTTHAVARALSEGQILMGGTVLVEESKWPGKDEALIEKVG
ncbi:regulatory protein, luxR family [Cognatiyoonia sediminum]|uniref:Regulatory protein, luxR family n=1 Tax=Cognatiyoonia sediminum TaxID=1508389 RepID=A0A1M5NJM0_9RHOB|nr:regulatory protein, luxR family [Cognatiyoonia sediminum]